MFGRRRRPRRVLVVYCHPNPESLVASARERAVAGARAAGHDVHVIDLYADGFEPALSADERRAHLEPGVSPELRHYADELTAAEVLVLVYPTWWSGQPAMLKGWFDRVWANGVAWELPEGARALRPRLRNLRRIVVVTTHGSSKLVNAVQGEPGKRTVSRALGLVCSRRARTTWCALYGVDVASEAKRAAFLERVERTLARV
jgi:NAD(P)H dehydrogenase (quinone)